MSNSPLDSPPNQNVRASDVSFNYPHTSVNSDQKRLVTVRESVLNELGSILLKDRNQAYGDPEDNFRNIADFWNTYLQQLAKAQGLETWPVQLAPHNVAELMALMKLARNIFRPARDNFVDGAGYFVCGAEASGVVEA